MSRDTAIGLLKTLVKMLRCLTTDVREQILGSVFACLQCIQRNTKQNDLNGLIFVLQFR